MSDTESTQIYLPKNLLYPLTVLKVHVKEGEDIKKYSPIVTYRYYDYEPVPISEEEEEQKDESERKLKRVEYVGTFESANDGKVRKVLIEVDEQIEDNGKAILEIVEPCTHPIQYGGLCAICGKAMEDEEREERAPIRMAHGTTDLKVSSKEAEDMERSSTSRLLKEQKLSLVVDLDQTVIHVTVDPTVAEWMNDPTNPNYEAVKDVRSFILEEPPFVPVGYKGPPVPPVQRWYYVKLRPGLQGFLEKMNERYEMHIYTMATRQYAESIARIIDPDGIYFGERILSRDESGSITQKSLRRLFPVDTSMVVVIDDRGDVWNWSPNLIKVVPYDFFLGIGDINSSFLPRQQSLLGPSKRRKSVNILEETVINEEKSIEPGNLASESAIEEVEPGTTTGDENGSGAAAGDGPESGSGSGSATSLLENSKPESDASNIVISDVSSSPVEILAELNDNEDGQLLAVQESERTSTLEHQEHDRPLAKLQENLDKIIEEGEEESAILDSEEGPSKAGRHKETSNIIEMKEAHNLLYDDDRELEWLGQALVRIHNNFYFEIEQWDRSAGTASAPDVKDIMTEMKSIVFKGCVFLLSGVLPLGTKLQNADIVIWAQSFGASFVENYTTGVTHVICKNTGTFKVRLAKSVDPSVKIVNPDWVFACMSLWDRVPEEKYTLKVDSLLSKSQVDDFLEFNGQKNVPSYMNPVDWSEIDEEMKEFMGSDYEDEADDDTDNEKSLDSASSAAPGKRPPSSSSLGASHPAAKHQLEDDRGDGNVNGSSKKPKLENLSEENSVSEDEFERDLLDHLADLE